MTHLDITGSSSTRLRRFLVSSIALKRSPISDSCAAVSCPDEFTQDMCENAFSGASFTEKYEYDICFPAADYVTCQHLQSKSVFFFRLYLFEIFQPPWALRCGVVFKIYIPFSKEFRSHAVQWFIGTADCSGNVQYSVREHSEIAIFRFYSVARKPERWGNRNAIINNATVPAGLKIYLDISAQTYTDSGFLRQWEVLHFLCDLRLDAISLRPPLYRMKFVPLSIVKKNQQIAVGVTPPVGDDGRKVLSQHWRTPAFLSVLYGSLRSLIFQLFNRSHPGFESVPGGEAETVCYDILLIVPPLTAGNPGQTGCVFSGTICRITLPVQILVQELHAFCVNVFIIGINPDDKVDAFPTGPCRHCDRDVQHSQLCPLFLLAEFVSLDERVTISGDIGITGCFPLDILPDRVYGAVSTT